MNYKLFRSMVLKQDLVTDGYFLIIHEPITNNSGSGLAQQSLEAYYGRQVEWKSCKMCLSCEISCSSTSGYSQIQHISNLCLSVFHHFCSSMKKLLFQTIVESEKFPLKLLSKNRQTFRNRSECQFLCKKTPT